MNDTIKIYKVTCTQSELISVIGTWFSLKKWSEDNDYYKGHDDGGCDYILPRGFSAGVNEENAPSIYHCSDPYTPCQIGLRTGKTGDEIPVLIMKRQVGFGFLFVEDLRSIP